MLRASTPKSRSKTTRTVTIEPLEARIAPAFAAVLDVSNLSGSDGFRVVGEASGDQIGRSVNAAGDINGDGFGDIVIASFGSGKSYVVFGKLGGFTTPFNLSSLDGTNGFEMTGEDAGMPVSGIGDINGDRFADLIVGGTHVIFGNAAGFPATLDVSSLNGTNGFALIRSTHAASVSAAGDFNRDGYDDFIIGDYEPGGQFDPPGPGTSYVVFGKATFPASLNLSTLDGTNGFKIRGEASDDRFGISVASGDINGDGLVDLVIGAYEADPNGSKSGAAYVIFGKVPPFAPVFNLSTLNGSNGFKLQGEGVEDYAGGSVGMGDVNGDGLDDIIVGAEDADKAYVVFGKTNGFTTPLNLSSLNGTNGFTIAAGFDEQFGNSTIVGDFNGDDYADILVGDLGANASGIDSGAAFVIFGKSTFPSLLDISSLNGSNGFQIRGQSEGDLLGWSIHGAGDINGDGVNDLILGAPYADGNGSNSGAAYVVFGTGVPGHVDLRITQTDGVNSTTPGAHLAYALSYANVGTVSSADVLITESLPIGTSFDAAASSSGWAETSPGSGTFEYHVAKLDDGDSGSVIFAANVLHAVSAGLDHITNLATIGDDGKHGLDSDSGNNTTSDSDALNAAPNLVLNLSNDSATGVHAGATVSFSLHYTNAGNQGAAGVVLTETLPAHTSFNSAASTAGWTETAPGSGTFTLSIAGELTSGANGTATFAANIANPVPHGVTAFTNMATLSDDHANGADPAPNNNTANVTLPLLLDPTFSSNGRTATFTDIDGDIVTVTITDGHAAHHAFFGRLRLVAEGDGARFEQLDVLPVHSNVSIVVVTPKGGTGDGKVNVGVINAGGRDLGHVRVDGDLGQIFAGDTNLLTPAIKHLDVLSFSALGSDPHSAIRGDLNALTVAGDFGAMLDVNFGSLGHAIIGGNLEGTVFIAGNPINNGVGSGFGSLIRVDGNIGPVTIGGDVVGGGHLSGIIAGGKLGVVKIGGDLRSDTATRPVVISAQGKLGATKIRDAVAIAGLTVGGDVQSAQILAGYSTGLAASNPDAAIGVVKIGGNWTASDLVAGARDDADNTLDDFFGDLDDELIPAGQPNLVARIARITIGGTVAGSDKSGDHFGFVAQEIAAFKAGGVASLRRFGPSNDTPLELALATGDVTVREV